MTRALWLVIRHELARLRGRGFVVGTLALLFLMIGALTLQNQVSESAATIRVGLTGQATGVQQVLQEESGQLGIRLTTVNVLNVSTCLAQVRAGRLDVLVSGPPDALQVIARGPLDDRLHAALDSVVRQQVIYAALAEAGLRPADVQAEVDAAHAQVMQLAVDDHINDQRVAVGLAVTILLGLSLLVFGGLAATGSTEEKSSRVAEMLLATVRPGQLMFGRVIGLAVVGLCQLVIIGVVAVPVSLVIGALTVPGLAARAAGEAGLWYLAGFLLYGCVFAAVGSLVSRPEDLPPVMAPPVLAIVLGLGAGIVVLLRNSTGWIATVLSVLPPFAPLIMPGRMALADVPAWQVLLAAVLTVVTAIVTAWLAARVHRHAILRTGVRVRLRDAF